MLKLNWFHRVAGERVRRPTSVARAPADGYTLLQVASSHAINVTLYEKNTVNVTRDIVPVASIAAYPIGRVARAWSDRHCAPAGVAGRPADRRCCPGYTVTGWLGIGAPKGTPKVVDRLNKEVNEALADPAVKTRMAEIGSEISPGSPADFGKFIADETEKWAKVIKFAGIKPGWSQSPANIHKFRSANGWCPSVWTTWSNDGCFAAAKTLRCIRGPAIFWQLSD
jgi:Tripartite tricarboxylate transporter family receptor